MEAALKAFANREMGYKNAADQFGIPKTTLKCKLKDGNKFCKGSSKSLGHDKTVFSRDTEIELVRYVLTME